jgi:hypothetical protein
MHILKSCGSFNVVFTTFSEKLNLALFATSLVDMIKINVLKKLDKS